MSLPIRDCYPVDARLLAGEYPGAADVRVAAARIQRFERHGVTHFVDLTHPADLLEPYDRHLAGSARIAHPIVDMGTTTIPHMVRILDDIDAVLDAGGSAYVHCWGGIGRTGTVIGCWLVRHGLDEGDPLGRLQALRRRVLDAAMPSPQTTAQRAMVTGWRRGR